MDPQPRALRPSLLENLRARPGASVSELARDLGVHHSTAAYHLARLEARGLVVLLRHRGRVHAFLAGHHTSHERARAVLARDPASARVLARVGAEPRRLGEVARGLPVSKAAVYWHLARLAALGLVAMEGPPRARTYRLADAAPGVQAPAPAFNQVPATG